MIFDRVWIEMIENIRYCWYCWSIFIYILTSCQSILIKDKWNWDDIESVKYLLVLPEIAEPGKKWFLSLKIERKSRANISVHEFMKHRWGDIEIRIRNEIS